MLRQQQVLLVREFMNSIRSGKSLVKQMIMGAGKTTVGVLVVLNSATVSDAAAVERLDAKWITLKKVMVGFATPFVKHMTPKIECFEFGAKVALKSVSKYGVKTGKNGDGLQKKKLDIAAEFSTSSASG